MLNKLLKSAICWRTGSCGRFKSRLWRNEMVNLILGGWVCGRTDTVQNLQLHINALLCQQLRNPNWVFRKFSFSSLRGSQTLIFPCAPTPDVAKFGKSVYVKTKEVGALRDRGSSRILALIIICIGGSRWRTRHTLPRVPLLSFWHTHFTKCSGAPTKLTLPMGNPGYATEFNAQSDFDVANTGKLWTSRENVLETIYVRMKIYFQPGIILLHNWLQWVVAATE